MTRLVADRNKSEGVFLGRTNQPLTRFGIHRLVTQYAAMAGETVPTLAMKRVSPHTVRHTTAVQAARRRRHQHDPCLAGPRVIRHHAHLC
nr:MULTISPECIES: hypothetical protein [unclassified Bradyrhizobium]